MLKKTTIGQAEQVVLPELGNITANARIDTGAQTSAIWASAEIDGDGTLSVIFFGKQSPLYTGEAIKFKDYSTAVVASSNGTAEERYKIRLPVIIAKRRIRAWFTLADRSKRVYPILVGRNILRGKFIVDIGKAV